MAATIHALPSSPMAQAKLRAPSSTPAPERSKESGLISRVSSGHVQEGHLGVYRSVARSKVKLRSPQLALRRCAARWRQHGSYRRCCGPNVALEGATEENAVGKDTGGFGRALHGANDVQQVGVI